MRTTTSTAAALAAILLPALFAAGWLVGLVTQWRTAVTTGYMDIHPAQLVLGLALFALAGASVRVDAPRFRRARAGAVAGVLALATIIAGYWTLALLLVPARLGEDSGETWFSLLLESWFWVGVPLVLSSVLGLAGWLAAGRLVRTGGPRAA